MTGSDVTRTWYAGGMSVLNWLGDHPVLTFLLLPSVLGFALRVIPWARRSDS